MHNDRLSDDADAAAARVDAALAELDRQGVSYTWRKPACHGSGSPAREVDLSLERRDVTRADRVLERVGFHALKARGHGRHRFYLSEVEGRWLKLDVKLAHGGAAAAASSRSLPAALAETGARLQRLRRRIPLSARRQGPVVAVLGPDGAGKGTVIERLQAEIPVHASVVYLGYRTRGRRSVGTRVAETRAATALEPAFVLKGFARSLRILLPAYARAWCGAIVLCDRHPVEALAIPPRRGRPAAALERFLIRHVLPYPDAVIVLDAPGETLFARKGEHSVETLERWRQAYRETFRGDEVTIASTVDPVESVVSQASHAVWNALARRRRWAR